MNFPIIVQFGKFWKRLAIIVLKKIDPEQYSECVVNEQLIRLYFIPGVPTKTKFFPKTNYEIRDCQWFPLELLPSSKKDPIPDCWASRSTLKKSSFPDPTRLTMQ